MNDKAVESTVERKTVREIPSIAVTVHESWAGKRTNTDKRYPDKSAKFSLSVPIPETEADAQALYGIPLVKLIEAGVTQGFYSARDIDNVIVDSFMNGLPADNDDVIQKVLDAAEETKFTARERVSQAKEVKALKADISSSGMSIAEAVEAMKKLKELRDKGIDINTL